jgi:integrase
VPEYLLPFEEAACITGWRQGELQNLRWSQVDWEAGGDLARTRRDEVGRAAHPKFSEPLRERRQTTRRVRTLQRDGEPVGVPPEREVRSARFETLASLTTLSWNQIKAWLQDMDLLRSAMSTRVA